MCVVNKRKKCRRGVCCAPLQDAHGRLPLLDEAHSAVVVPLVLDGHAADLHHHVPQLLGGAPALFRTRQLFARGGEELTKLSAGSRAGKFNHNHPPPPPPHGRPDVFLISSTMENEYL